MQTTLRLLNCNIFLDNKMRQLAYALAQAYVVPTGSATFLRYAPSPTANSFYPLHEPLRNVPRCAFPSTSSGKSRDPYVFFTRRPSCTKQNFLSVTRCITQSKSFSSSVSIEPSCICSSVSNSSHFRDRTYNGSLGCTSLCSGNESLSTLKAPSGEDPPASCSASQDTTSGGTLCKEQRHTQDVLSSRQNLSDGAADEKGADDMRSEDNKTVPKLTWQQWRHVFVCSAFPMIGFGLMDQVIMIRAGDLIDNTIGVTLGLATLSAAAVGQLCSDTSGVLFGNTIDSIAQTWGLTPPEITQEQRGSPSFRLATTLGAACGVAFGCILGMLQLPFMDLDKPERLKRQKELDTIFEMVMSDGPKLFHCERATLFVYDKSKGEIWSKAVFGLDQAIRIHRNKSKSFTTWVLDNKEILNCKDAYQDERFNPTYDQKYKYKTRSVLAAPVVDRHGEVMAVLMFINKHEEDGGVFTVDDERMMEMMCKHVQIFMEKFDYGAADDKRMISLREDDEVCQRQVARAKNRNVQKPVVELSGETVRANGHKEVVQRAGSNHSHPSAHVMPLANVTSVGTALGGVAHVAPAAALQPNAASGAGDEVTFFPGRLARWIKAQFSNEGKQNSQVAPIASREGSHSIPEKESGVLIGSSVESNSCCGGNLVSSPAVIRLASPVVSNRANPSNPLMSLNNDTNALLSTRGNNSSSDAPGMVQPVPPPPGTPCSNPNSDMAAASHRHPPYWNLHYPHLYDYQHHLTGKIVEINRGEDF